jgi:hypothetical protein
MAASNSDKHCSFGVSDIVSFDFQHLLSNTHFSTPLYFNEFVAMLARSGPAHLLPLPMLETGAVSLTRIDVSS